MIDGQARPTTALNRTDFAWVPKAHPMGSTVQSENGHWITSTPGKREFRNQSPLRLSEGEYFVLGDNRDDSDDSEDSRQFGPVSENLLLGKVVFTFAAGERTR